MWSKVIAFLRLLMPVLTIIEPAYMKFLIVLAVLMIAYLRLDPRGPTFRARLAFRTIVMIALLGGLLQVIQWFLYTFIPPSRR
jgi:hypothetical protein